MSHPLPLSHFHDQLLAAQWILNPTLTKPITCSRALLILSRPVSSVEFCDQVLHIHNFFDIFWINGDCGSWGWFDSEGAAVRYAQAWFTEPRDAEGRPILEEPS